MDREAGSITRLIPDALDRNELAIQELWRRYVYRVQGVARPLLAGLAAGGGDEEDVAQSAFRAFFDAAAQGKAPQLEGRDDLWRLLATISRRKATDRVRRELRERRGGGVNHMVDQLPNVAGDDPTPSQVVELQEVLDRVLQELDATGDPKLKMVAVLRLEGATTSEIAQRLACTTRTIQRKLHILERLWTNLDE